MVSVAPYTDVYLGLWGYNAMLTAGGLSYFLVPLPGVFLAAIVAACLAGAVQAATVHIFSAVSNPSVSVRMITEPRFLCLFLRKYYTVGFVILSSG